MSDSTAARDVVKRAAASRTAGLAPKSGSPSTPPNGGKDDQPLASFTMLTINADAHPLMRRFHRPDDEKRMLVLLGAQDSQVEAASLGEEKPRCEEKTDA